jgi:hypothetical protein
MMQPRARAQWLCGLAATLLKHMIEAHGKIPKTGRSLLIKRRPRLKPADYPPYTDDKCKRAGTAPNFGCGPVEPACRHAGGGIQNTIRQR